MRTTDWVEVQRFTFVCMGCARECTVTRRGEMKQGQDCDATKEMVKAIVKENQAYMKGVE